MLARGLVIAPESIYFVGALVNGALRDVVTMILCRDKRGRFIAAVRFLGQGAAIELRDWQVELAPIDSPAHSGPQIVPMKPGTLSLDTMNKPNCMIILDECVQ